MIKHLLCLLSLIAVSESYLSAHNDARRRAGVYNRLQQSSTLESSARRVADWLCRTGQFKHSSTSSSGYGDGKRPSGLAESIAGHGSIDAGVKAFIDERQYYRNGRCQSGKVCGHYEIIINPSYAEVGCANKRGCSGSMKLGRVACHYKRGGRFEEYVEFNKDDCGAEYYDGDMCLYTNDKVMRFTTEQERGCEFEEKIYKHTDAAHNSYFLHYHPFDADDNSTDETESQWLVSRDYVSDIAQFWCDSDSLMDCEKGRWSKNIFAELGVSEEIDDGITIKQCHSLERIEEKATVHPILYILLGALAVIVIGGPIYCVLRCRNRGRASIKHVEITDEEEVEVNQTIEC